MSDLEATKLAGVNLKESEVVDNGYNTTVQKNCNNNRRVFIAVISYIKTVAQPFVALTRSTRADEAVTSDHSPQSSIPEHEPVEIRSPNPSSLHPFSQLSKEYLRTGVNIGGIGFVGEGSTLDFLFNISPPQNLLFNPRNLPNGFSLATRKHSETKTMKSSAREACFLPPTVTITKSDEHICKESQGAIPEAANGAIQHEVIKGRRFSGLAKCPQWGAFHWPCDPRQGGWKGLSTFTAEDAIPNQGNAPKQCVFLRDYKNMIRQDLCTQQLSTRQRVQRLSDIVSHPNFNAYLSDLIHAAPNHVDFDFVTKYYKLKSKLNTDAKVALHDDEFPNSYATLRNIAQSYKCPIDKSGCISLEQISDSINVLNESNCPPQVSALQRPLTTLHKDYTPVPATISLTLPSELLERILLLLDIEHILTCRLINREFNESIQSSVSLQYFLACKAAGVIDNPRSSLSYAARLDALEKREDAWRNLNPVFKMTIEVNRPPSSISTYGLTGGAYFLKDNIQGDLHYCHLPSSLQEIPRWIRIPGHGPGEGIPGIFVSFALAVYEHDLIINVISSDIGNEAGIQQHSLDLVLLKFTTGEYHPLARQHRIHIQRSSSARPWVIPRIVGDNLALVVHSQNGACPDKLFIFDWKTGHKRLQHETTEDAYSDLVFVSPELLLVPNIMLSHFEIWHLPPPHLKSEPPSQILSLKIPAVSPEYAIFNLGCHGEPNPFLHSIPYFPPRPFFTSPENSIIIVNLIISTISPSVRRRRASYTLIMHRRALLDTIQKWTSPPLLEQIVLPALMNEVTVHKVADPGDGSAGLCAQSKMVSMMSHLRSSALTRDSPTSQIFVDSGFSPGSPTTPSMSQYSSPQVQWADWGPPISRWFQVNETQARWIMNSTGQRFAFSVPNDRGKLMVSVADFNPYNVSKNVEMMARLRRESEDDRSNSDNDKEGKDEGDEEEWETLEHEGMFSEEVHMGLKCVVYPAPGEYDFDGVLMDEERLLGLKCNHRGRVESVKVLYFG